MGRIRERDDTRPIVSSWAGRRGYDELLARRRIRTADPAALRVELREMCADGVILNEWRSTPLSVVSPFQQSAGIQALRIVIVAGGRVRYSAGSEAVDAGKGSALALLDGTPMTLEIAEPTRLLSASIPLTALPSAVSRMPPKRLELLPRTVSSAGFMTLLDQIAVSSRTDGGPSVHTVRALRALAAAVLLEARDDDDVERALRDRIVDHIEDHLTDHDLNPRTIADAFGISVRWVHVVFNRGDTSVARFIRDGRLDRIAEQLRTDRRFVRVGALATAYGFAGRDQLTRAFRARYGVTVNVYHDIALRGGRLPQSSGSHEQANRGAA